MDTDTITINNFTGDQDGSDLKGCFFRQTARGLFLLFAADKSPIHTSPKPVPNGIPFTFKYQEKDWTAAFVYSDSTSVGAGIWSASPKHGRGPDDPESGTFQAQGGTGTGDDLEASASASA